TGLENNLATNQPEIVCYPNPFSNEISIEIILSEEAQVQVEIYNQLSQQVKLLANRQTLPAGRHTLVWDGNNAGNQKVSPGIYHVRFATDEIQTFTKIIFAAQ